MMKVMLDVKFFEQKDKWNRFLFGAPSKSWLPDIKESSQNIETL